MGLRVEEEHNDELEGDPTTVYGHELPTDSGQGQRVDVIGEEKTKLSKHLLDTDTAVSLPVWPEFKQVGCVGVRRLVEGLHNTGLPRFSRLTIGQCIIADVIGWLVGKVEEQSCNARRRIGRAVILSHLQVIEGDCHSDEDAKHESGRCHESQAALEPCHEQGNDDGGRLSDGTSSAGQDDGGCHS